MFDPLDRSDELCIYCAAVNVPQILTGPTHQKSKYGDGSISVLTPFVENCRFCSLLSKTIENYGLVDRGLSLKWCSIPCDVGERAVLILKDSHSNSGWLALEDQEEYCLDLGPDLVYARRLQANIVDWEIVKGWLQDCEERHTGSSYMLCCNPSLLELPGFLVIDCTTRKIVPAPPGCRYTVLSYVWGPAAEDSVKFCWSLPSRVPLTIEDAILCTQALEIRYLWVDRYCIDQENHDTKHHLIQNMDKIYGCATVTIIGAVGSNSNAGLPGVSTTPRQPQEFVNIDGKQMSVISNTADELGRSKWWTRGWTFQEGVLPSRRIVFTQSQIYFQCFNMYCCESLSCAFRADHLIPGRNRYTELQVFPLAIQRGHDLVHNTRIPGDTSTIQHFDRYLRRYLEKELSYESDILNAFMGILSRFSVLETPVHHFWGMPFQPLPPSSDGEKPNSFGFLFALRWLPVLDFVCTPLTKRVGFPSWTWAAWRGITGTIAPESCRLSDLSFDASVEIEDMLGKRLSVDDYVQTKMDDYRFQPWLYLTGWTTTIYVRNCDIFADLEYQYSLKAIASWIENPSGNISSSQGIPLAEPWLVFLYIERGAFFKQSNPSKSTECGRAVAGLILRPTGANSYERVGVFDLLLPPPRVCLGDNAVYLECGTPDKWAKLWCKKCTIKLV